MDQITYLNSFYRQGFLHALLVLGHGGIGDGRHAGEP